MDKSMTDKSRQQEGVSRCFLIHRTHAERLLKFLIFDRFRALQHRQQ